MRPAARVIATQLQPEAFAVPGTHCPRHRLLQARLDRQLGQAGLLKEVPIRLNRPGPYSRLGTTSRYAAGRHGPLPDHHHSRGVRPILCAGSPSTQSLAGHGRARAGPQGSRLAGLWAA